MGMTLTEKIIARHSEKEEVYQGEFVQADCDLIMANELSGILAIEELEKRGINSIPNPEKIVLVPDHFTPNKDIKTAQITKKFREFARKNNIEKYYEIGEMGIAHVLLPEEGLIGPGDLIIGGDSHTTTYGALSAFSTGVGSTDIAGAWLTGKVWLKVPESIKIILKGRLSPFVSGKDIILSIIGDLGVNGAAYKAIEFTVDTTPPLSMSDRFTIANMSVEMGAKNGIFEVDEKTEEFLKEVTNSLEGERITADDDARYSLIKEYDLTDLVPQVAVPHSPGNVLPVKELNRVKLDQVVIGFCTNGRIEDLRAAAEILKGRKVAKSVRTIIYPGTQRIYLRAIREGLIETFISAGCAVSTPTCGPCIGGHMGVLGRGEVCLSTSNRNFRGRMGDLESKVYLSSPAVAAASAVLGYIASPEELL